MSWEKENVHKKRTIRLDGSLFVVGEGGFEPPKSVTTDLQSAPFGRSGIPPWLLLAKRDMVGLQGLEPRTDRL